MSRFRFGHSASVYALASAQLRSNVLTHTPNLYCAAPRCSADSVPFPSVYGGQTQLAFAYQQTASWPASRVPSTIGGVAATSGFSSVLAAATADALATSSDGKSASDGFHWPTWATGVAAGGGAALLLAVAAGVWLCCRRRKSKRNEALAARQGSMTKNGAYGEKAGPGGAEEYRALEGTGDYPPYPAPVMPAVAAEGKRSNYRGVPNTRQADANNDPYGAFGALGSRHARMASDGTDDAGYATPANGSAIDLTGSPARLFHGPHSDSPIRGGSPAPALPAALAAPAGGKLPFSERTTPYAWGGLPAPRSSQDHSRSSHDRPRTPTSPIGVASGGSNLQHAGRSPVRSPNRSSVLNPQGRSPGRPTQERYDRSEAVPTSPVMGSDEGTWAPHEPAGGLQPAWSPSQGQYHQMSGGPGSGSAH